jgi:hypothetical protein
VGSAELLSHQGDLVSDEDSEVICFVGGVRSGKTWGMCAKAALLGAANGTLPLLFVEPTYRMLEDVALRTFIALFDDWGVPYHFIRSRMTLSVGIGEGFEILLRSADKKESLMGLTVCAALLDEAGQCKEDVAEEMVRRVSHPDARVKQTVLGGTPEGINWFRDWAEEPPDGINSRLIRARTDDNPHMDADYIERICAYMSPEEIQMRREGKFVPAGGKVYHRFDRNIHVATCDQPTEGRVQMWCDFNISCQAWAFARVLGGEAHVFAECVGEGDTQTRAEIAVGMLKDYGINPRDVDVYCDASGTARKTSASRSDVQHLKRAGFRKVLHPPANPRVRDRVDALNLMLSEGRLFIDPRASFHLKCISTQGRDKHGDPDKSAGLDHGSDSIGYGVVNQWPVRTPSRGNSQRYH